MAHSQDLLQQIENLLAFCESDFLLNISEDFHVSLTRTVVLRHHWIEDFVAQIRKSVSQIPRFDDGDKVFSLKTNNPVSYTHLTLPTILRV